MKDTSGPLAPIFCEPSPRGGHAEWGGITHRQWLAGLAISGLCANPGLSFRSFPSDLVEEAYQIADAALAYEQKENG